ncbi:hypothetical protein BpHYR1_012983 [Brachionus plicatilis]|uniref:Uncharacterized protein n=1 Tax=Brachionus plicatilis TaxID=10195 RepID=A0A3M7QVX0_BRAPC|nr:hypothetical protein BpHYR1_012983 [Brachionus plicatilis]
MMFPSTGYDRAGSLSLKSSLPMDYGRAVLSNKWHLKREAEPVDFELWSGNKPNLHQSTYKMLSKNIPSEKISDVTETRYKHEEALRLLEEMRNIDPKRDMVDMNNKDRLLENFDPNSSALPKHQPGHNKHHLETTYKKDFLNPNPELEGVKSQKAQKIEFENSVDNSFTFRRMVSQFSDIDAPKRAGINTFHVQHGQYPNQVIKHHFLAKNQNNIFGL